MPHSVSLSVKHLSFNDLLLLNGRQPQTEGLNVFVKKQGDKKDIIPYPFRSDHFLILLINSGVVSIKLNLLEYNLTENDLIIVAPNTIRQFVKAAENCTVTGLAFTPDFLLQTGIQKKYIAPFNFFAANGNPHLRLSGEDAAMLNKVVKILLQKNLSMDGNPFGLDIVQHYFSAFLYELASLYRIYNADAKIKLTRKEDLSMRFLKLLPDHFREERSVQYYAGQLFVTPKYLTQSLKEITGKTAGAFIDEMVIMEAKVLLGDQSLSVAQVAESLFFSDQFFFSKFFKNQIGVAPTEYRKSL